jgi:hypothetical protein
MLIFVFCSKMLWLSLYKILREYAVSGTEPQESYILLHSFHPSFPCRRASIDSHWERTRDVVENKRTLTPSTHLYMLWKVLLALIQRLPTLCLYYYIPGEGSLKLLSLSLVLFRFFFFLFCGCVFTEGTSNLQQHYRSPCLLHFSPPFRVSFSLLFLCCPVPLAMLHKTKPDQVLCRVLDMLSWNWRKLLEFYASQSSGQNGKWNWISGILYFNQLFTHAKRH